MMGVLYGKTTALVKVIVVLTFMTMLIVNVLANILPINEVTTGQVSDSFPNLFAPAGLTFSIWGLIYLLLAGYTLYHVGLFRNNTKKSKTELFNKIGILFSVSSIANATWVFSWHYYKIPLTMLLIVVILICLILINRLTTNKRFSTKDYLFIRLPFSVYFGWITIATIANANVLLVSIGWDWFGLSEVIWTVVILAVGLTITTVTMIKNRDVAYGLVIIWAYAGILLKHVSSEGFGTQYPVIIATTIISITLLLLAEAYILTSKKEEIVFNY